ncbi:hypothetical protein N2W54_001296 [Lotmaria passim]
MPIPSVKMRPAPPRRTPPAASANLTHEVSAGTYVTSHLRLKLNGVAATSQQLIQAKDSVNDVKVALATADNTIQRITTNPALLGPAPGDTTKGGVDIQSLQYAATTRAKLSEKEQQQDAHYAQLSEMASVRQEIRKAANDSALQRYRKDVECQLAASTLSDARVPRRQDPAHPIPPEEQQTLLNPFTTARWQTKSSALMMSSAVPTNSASNGDDNRSGSSGCLSAPPAAVANGRYRPQPSTAAPPMPQPPGRMPGSQGPYAGAYGDAPLYPPTVTPATVASGYPAPPGNAGYYGASSCPAQGQPRPAYAQYGQQPFMGNARPTYTAL